MDIDSPIRQEPTALKAPDIRMSQSTPESATSTASSKEHNKSSCLIILGMAGSGKTTFVDKLAEHLFEEDTPAYLVNLDPACLEVPYPSNIDIRDTINYKRVMKEYELGPNGAIITSLNLFATKFDQLATLIDQKKNEMKHFIFDTPGQIEIFNWSASGMIITETLASLMPTAIVYVMDTVRNRNPATFMSNMLYACSMVYKSKLPIIVVLNKTDLQPSDFIMDWMTNFDSFVDALENEKGYISNLTRSLALALDSFYSELKTVAVSSVTGIGMTRFLEAVEEARKEYNEIYLPEREAAKEDALKIARDLQNMTVKVGTIPEEDEDDQQDE